MEHAVSSALPEIERHMKQFRTAHLTLRRVQTVAAGGGVGGSSDFGPDCSKDF
jgi:hypothetical protein